MTNKQRDWNSIKPDKETLETLIKEGLEFGLMNRDKKPFETGWRENPEQNVLDRFYQINDAEQHLCGLLDYNEKQDNRFFVIDIDKPDDSKSQELISLLDDSNCWKSCSRKGVHYWFKECIDSKELATAKTVKIKNKAGSGDIGDMLSGGAIVYKRVDGILKKVSDINGLFYLLTGRKSSRENLIILKQRIRMSMSKLKKGNRYNGMRDIIALTIGGIKNLRLKDSIPEIAKYVSDEYLKVKPEGSSEYKESYILEIIQEKAGGEANNIHSLEGVSIEDDEYDPATICFEYIINKRDGNIKVSGNSSNIMDRTVFEWDEDNKEWIKNKIGFIDEEKEERKTIIQEMEGMISRLYEDRYAKRPTRKTINDNIDELKKTINNNITSVNLEGMYDVCNETQNKVYIDEGKVLDIICKDDPKDSGVEIIENKPEFRLYNRLGSISNEKPKRWLEFLHQVFKGNESLINLTRDILASAFIHGTDPSFIVLNGTGKNGKTVFIRTIDNAFGELASMVEYGAFSRSGNGEIRQLAERAKMVGRRFVLTDEGNTDQLDNSFMKKLTDNAPINVGGMHKDSWSVRVKCVPFVSTNVIPKFNEVNVATRRRIKVLPFEQTFGDDKEAGDLPEDRQLTKKLFEEAPQIRGWVVEGIKDLLARGCKMTVSPEAEVETKFTMETNMPDILKDLNKWLVKTDEVGEMIIGMKSKSNTGRYKGIMALAHLSFEDNEGQQKHKPVRKTIQTYLQQMGIKDRGRGRMNCALSDDGKALLTDNRLDHLDENLNEKFVAGNMPDDDDYSD